MPMTTMTWAVMFGSIAVLWGVGVLTMYRTLTDEERKLTLLDAQGQLDTYSPTALAELRSWIEANPNDPYVEEAIERHDECVRTLREIDEPFYDWSEAQIQDLETIEQSAS